MCCIFGLKTYIDYRLGHRIAVVRLLTGVIGKYRYPVASFGSSAKRWLKGVKNAMFQGHH